MYNEQATERYFSLLIKLAKKASKKGEIPVSALIVKDNKIIAKAFNKKERKNNPLNHAEIMVIQKACHKIKNWHLSECDLYVTLKPCQMCSGAIAQARINKVIYLLDKPITKKEYYKTEYIKAEDSSQIKDYQKILSDFFKNKRRQK